MNVHLMFSVLLDLMRYEKVTAQALAEKLELSTRTIYRYVDHLSANGVPVTTCTGRNGGIFLTQKYDLRSIFFTTQDLDLLTDLLHCCASAHASFLIEKISVIRATSPRNALSRLM